MLQMMKGVCVFKLVQALAYNMRWKWFYHHYYGPFTCSWNHFTKEHLSEHLIGGVWVPCGGCIRWLSFGGVLLLVPTKMARRKLVEVQLIVMTSQVGNTKYQTIPVHKQTLLGRE